MKICTLMKVLLLKQKWLRPAAQTVRAGSLLILLSLFMQRSWAQTGLLNDDFSTGNTNNWKAATSGATGQIVNGRFVVTMAPQTGGKYRGDFQKTGGVTFNAGAYPIVAIKFNKPPRCNYFFDTNLGSFNGTNNNATKVASATGNVYYWDLSTGTLGTTSVAGTTTTLTSFTFKVADVVLTSAEVAANDIQFEVDWVKTFASVDELRAYVGVNNPPSFSFTGTFAHPGLLHNAADLARMKSQVANKIGRPYASYQLLAASTRASATYQMAGPYAQLTRDATVTVNGVNGGSVKNGVEADFLAAYYNALMYNINGNEAHAKKAVEIIDAYAATTTGIIGADAALNGLYGCMLANAAEIMRATYSAWPVDKQQQAGTMLKNVFYPVLQNFSPCSHGNWDIICMKALMAIAVYNNDTDMFNRVVTYFYHGEGNGSIDNYVVTAAGQLQESNRDQGHVLLAIGSLAELAEMANKQGVDLYSASGNAIMRGYEYASKYNLGNTVDYQTSYDYCEKNYTDYTPEAISATARGQFRPVFEIAYNHYVVRKGLQMPWTLQVMQATGPEAAPAGADNPGYGSLFFYLNTAADYPKDSTTAPVDTTIGLINDNFTSTADGWAAVTSGSVATVADGKLNVTLVTTSGKGRGDVKKTAGATLFPTNYPIFAIKFKKPTVANITFDTNLGSFGNGANKWTGKVGDDVYYYDLTKGGFGATPTMLSKDVATKLTTFQFKIADITSGETGYAIEWIKTVKTVADLVEVVPPSKSQTITFDTLATVILGDTTPVVLKATASSGLPVSYTISDTTIATIVNNKVIVKTDGTVTITASQAGDATYLAATSVARTLIIKDTISGLIDDNFIGTNDGWAAATSGSVATVQDGKLVVTLVPQSNAKGRGDAKKTAGAKLLPNNYPIVAIRFKKPQVANITFDTNLGSFGNGSNKWTGTVGDDIYYYDLTKGTFGATATKLPADRGTKLTTFQFKVADISSGETSYAIEWVKTVKSIEDLKNTLPHVQQSISFDSLAAVTIGDSIVLNATASSELPVSYEVSDSTIASILNGVVTAKQAGTVIITASQAGDSAYLPAASVSRTLTVNKLAQSISFDSLAAVTLGDTTPIVLNATASSGLAVSFAVSDTAIATIVNGVVIPKHAGTVVITASQEGNSVYLAAASVERILIINKIAQNISFDALPAVLLGDTAAIVLHATASSNLPISYTVSDASIATINNGVVKVLRDGTVTITASQSGDSDYLPAASVARTLTIAPLNIAVQSLDGDKGKTENNSINPYLQLVNQGKANVAYSELTARYWFTAENFAGINTFIDYAQLGNSKVKMKYVQLEQPRAGAYGYVEYSFDKSAGNLVANGNSGVIQSRFANTDWTNFNEADDYSYASNDKAYANNSHITLYRNGQLVWGVEPAAVTPEVKVKVYSSTQNGGNNTISTYVTINNEGNMPVAYGDLSVRYWFTADGNAALNAWVDYAKLGSSNIITSFNGVSPVATGADKYFEIKIKPELGSLYPAANTGNIQYRIAKSDWSNFSFANDYSYTAPAKLAVNDHMTVYYKGQLIFGTEPTAASQTRMAANTPTAVIDNLNTAADKIVLYPNPATDHFNIQVGTVAPDAVVRIYSLRGELLLTQRITAATQSISLQSLTTGIYQVEVRNGKTVTTKQVIKH
ncbi:MULTISPECIES: DUF4979 domain-containing protein [Niastella]|uniref:DUF4979 domain-containing protein n=1 Tax=Niastella soli TaxID=2821487 RepID=A0ABS3Z2L1_9BACT|nr:DUF4979 domain-containing protein [Niastella soli]MBO9204365.1 DUF4979 domain-containing protein [Niastella soli]